MLGAVSRSRELARRSSFGSELFAARGAADGPRAHFLALRETVHGPASTEEISRLREEGGGAIPADLAIDGMSVFSALLVDPARPPSENSMAGRLRWLSEKLRTEQIEDLLWRDARDMRADP